VNTWGTNTDIQRTSGDWSRGLGELKPGAQIALICTVATGALWLALVIIAPAGDPWINILLGAILFFPCLVAFLLQVTPAVVKDTTYLQAGFGAVVTDRRGHTQIYGGDVKQQSVAYSPANGDHVEQIDCRQRVMSLPHVCLSKDGATVVLTIRVVWSITALAKFRAVARDPSEIVDAATLAAFTSKLGALDGAAINAPACAGIVKAVIDEISPRLQAYGAVVNDIYITHIQMWPKPSDDKGKPAGK
jgi:hypothetical protein